MAVSFIDRGNRKNRLVASYWQTLSHIKYTSQWARFELTTLVGICADCICSYKSNNHTITTTTVLDEDGYNIVFKFGEIGTYFKKIPGEHKEITGEHKKEIMPPIVCCFHWKRGRYMLSPTPCRVSGHILFQLYLYRYVCTILNWRDHYNFINRTPCLEKLILYT